MNPLTPYPITPMGSFIGFLLAVIPLPLQFHKWNTAICVYGLWLAVTNFQYFVNFAIWHDNVDIVAPVWCDMVTRIQVSVCSGIRACTFVLSLQLFRISRRSVVIDASRSEKRKALLIDLSLTVGVPFVVMALYVVIQPVRFYIIEEVGCQNVEFSYLTYVIIYLPELSFALASACLAPWTLTAFLRLRRETKTSLQGSNRSTSSGNSALSPGNFKRLLIMTLLDTIINLPILITSFAKCILAGKNNFANYPYKSWDYVHNGAGGVFPPGTSLGTIVQVPASEWSQDKWFFTNVKWIEWVYVLHAVIYFLVFGTMPKLRRLYVDAFWTIWRWLGCPSRAPRNQVRHVSSAIHFGRNTAEGVPLHVIRFNSTISFDGTTACECPPSVVIYSSDSSDEAASSKAKVLEMGGANLNSNSSAVDANSRSESDMFQSAV